jgi:autotransporter-associated beta strand protein/predicted outer membrane repeat protein
LHRTLRLEILETRFLLSDAVYLLITSEALASAFQPLVERRTAQGKPGELVTTEWIDAHYDGTRPDGGSDLQTKVRNCIIDYQQNHSTRWVCIGGDDVVLPPRYYSGTYCTDLYYGDLGGTWDDNGNGVYGEKADNADLAPEVYVGRIPVQTPEQAAAYINKLIRYETASPDGYANSMLLPGYGGRYSGQSRPIGYQDHEPVDVVEHQVLNLYRNSIAPFWQATPQDKLFDSITSWDTDRCGDYELTKEHEIERFSQGYHHVFISSHGSPYHCACLSTSIAEAMTNSDRPTIFYIIACSTAAFDYRGTCLSETLLRNPHGGAVAYIGFLRVGGGTFAAPVQFYKELYQNHRATVGEAFGESLKFFAPSRALGGNAFNLNLQGDPALVVLGEESGRNLQVSSPAGCEVIDAGATITVRWNAAGTGFASGEKVRLDFSADSGNSWQPIAGAESVVYNGRAFEWDASALPTGLHYRVRVTSVSDPSVSAASYRDFRIAEIGMLTVRSTPMQGIKLSGTQANTTDYTYSVLLGDAVTLTAPAQAQYNFVRWRDAAGNTLTQQMTLNLTFVADTTVVAEYQASGAPCDYYVNDEIEEGGIAAGDDENDGRTPQTPKRRIQAILDAYSDVGTIHVAPGEYYENLTVTSADSGITLEGAGADITIIDGGGAGNCLRLDGAGNVTIRGLAFQNGLASTGGGVYCKNTSLVSSDCLFDGSTASTYGGGLYVTGTSTAQLTGCIFRRNDATASYGGAIYFEDGSLTLEDCLFEDNSAGGLAGGIYASSAVLQISRCEFTGNSAPSGAALTASGCTLAMAESTVHDNMAANYGGGLYVSGNSTAQFTDCTFSRNDTSVYYGGALYIAGGSLTLEDCLFEDNSAGNFGGGVYATGAAIQVDGCEFTGSSAPLGAALMVSGGMLTVAATTVHDNVAHSYGGGLYVNQSATAQFTGCTFSRNDTSVYYGGAIDFSGGSLTLEDCLFEDNSAGNLGGGIYATEAAIQIDGCEFAGNIAPSGAALMASGGTLTMAESTIHDNAANSYGGGIYGSGCALDLTGCTFTGNSSAYGGAVYAHAGSATVRRCEFRSNEARDFGGGVELHIVTTATIAENTFSDNWAARGAGGLYLYSATATVSDNVIARNSASGPSSGGGGISVSGTGTTIQRNWLQGNHAGLYGGGVYLNGTAMAVDSNVLVGNTSTSGGGLYLSSTFTGTLTNLTLARNVASYQGGGAVVFASGAVFANSVFWQDAAPTGPEIVVSSAGSLSVYYSDIFGGWAGAGSDNFNEDPRFVRNPNDGGDGWGVGENDDYGDLRLLPNSPCIDAASNASVPAGITTDLAGNPRFVDVPAIPDTGIGIAPIVDVGAYESPNPHLVVAGTDSPDEFSLSLSADKSSIRIIAPGTSNTYSVLAITQLIVSGGEGDDRLTVDFANDNPVPSGGVTFDGQGGSDGVRIVAPGYNATLTGEQVSVGTAAPIGFSNTEGTSLDLGAGRLIKSGSSTAVLVGANNYAGGTQVLEGTLRVTTPHALPTGGALSIGPGASVLLAPSLSGAAAATIRGQTPLVPEVIAHGAGSPCFAEQDFTALRIAAETIASQAASTVTRSQATTAAQVSGGSNVPQRLASRSLWACNAVLQAARPKPCWEELGWLGDSQQVGWRDFAKKKDRPVSAAVDLVMASVWR